MDPHHEVSGPLHFVNDKGGNRSRTQIPPSASKSSKIKDPNSSICIQAASPSRAWYLPTSWGPGAVSCLQQKPGSTNVYKLLARAAPGIADWQFDLGHLLNWPTTSKHILNSEAKSGASLRLRGPCARLETEGSLRQGWCGFDEDNPTSVSVSPRAWNAAQVSPIQRQWEMTSSQKLLCSVRTSLAAGCTSSNTPKVCRTSRDTSLPANKPRATRRTNHAP